MQCAYPEKLRGRNITELKEEEICDTERVSFKKVCKPPAGSSNTWNCENLGLDFVPYDIFHRKTRLSLRGEYMCDCNIVFVMRRLKYEWDRNLLPNNAKIRCKGPGKFSQKKLYTLKENDVCPQKEPNVCKALPCPVTSICEVTGATSYRCADLDECWTKLNNCDKNAKCINTDPGYLCRCRPGYTQYNDGRVCQDFDECSQKSLCAKDAKCINLPGSYKCECDAGFSGDGTFCEDINECVGRKRCSVHAECKNTQGSYECTCKKGYRVKDLICADIDECSQNPCPVQSTCQNTVGSYSCKCLSGYEWKHTRCLDLDECKTNIHKCDKNAVCFNLVGGYKCRCKDGYENVNNGRLCAKSKTSKYKSPHILLISTSTCVAVGGVALLIGLAIYFERKMRKKDKEHLQSDDEGQEPLLNQEDTAMDAVFMFNPHANRTQLTAWD
ncbi:fibrillin-2-like [Dendronephthya gigantea]|uniref:fibrillin-2-like n=1 Tax=Dendronephthya gigantea TaxID=151771 RepID=UPI00106D103D|nr:fibrillin-2-like [Dendronephthya gigantea]